MSGMRGHAQASLHVNTTSNEHTSHIVLTKYDSMYICTYVNSKL